MVGMSERFVARSRLNTIGIASVALALGMGVEAAVWQTRVSIILRVCLGTAFGIVAVYFAIRALRAGVVADHTTVTVRNLVFTYGFAWSEIASIECGRNTNVTGLASTVLTTRTAGGRPIPSVGAASYSRAKVDGWVRGLLNMSPSEWTSRTV
jgi:hypothetical protein